MVLVSGITSKPTSQQEDKSAFGHAKIFQNPMMPHSSVTNPKVNQVRVSTTSKPNIETTRRSETKNTPGTFNPFEIDKIEPLQPKIARNLTTTTAKGNFLFLSFNNYHCFSIGLVRKVTDIFYTQKHASILYVM